MGPDPSWGAVPADGSDCRAVARQTAWRPTGISSAARDQIVPGYTLAHITAELLPAWQNVPGEPLFPQGQDNAPRPRIAYFPRW